MPGLAWWEGAHGFYLAHGWEETGRAFTKLLTDVAVAAHTARLAHHAQYDENTDQRGSPRG